MTNVIETFDFDHDNRRFRAELIYDEDSGCPWDNFIPLGEVSQWTARTKTPGERVLADNRHSRLYYDFATAVRNAREGGVGGDKAAAAAEQEFQYFRDWCNNEWHYVGVAVFPLTEDRDELRSRTESLWGVEYSGSNDEYIREVAHDLASQSKE